MTPLEMLAKKGIITIVESPGKTIVAIKSGRNVITLEGGPKAELLWELAQVIQNWPDASES